MSKSTRKTRFSIIDAVITVVIIAVIAAAAIRLGVADVLTGKKGSYEITLVCESPDTKKVSEIAKDSSIYVDGKSIGTVSSFDIDGDLTVVSIVRLTETDKAYLLSGEKIACGSALTVRIGNAEFETLVVGIEKPIQE